jgi:hypothetical protein
MDNSPFPTGEDDADKIGSISIQEENIEFVAFMEEARGKRQ